MEDVEIIKTIEPHTDEWEAARNDRLTSSECHKLFTRSNKVGEYFSTGAQTYIWKVIGQILTGVSKKTPETEPILRGLSEEQYARERYIALTGHEVTDSCFIAYNSIFGGTNDGNIIIDGKVRGIIEIKCPDSAKYAKIAACRSAQELKLVDPQYYPQVQANIMISGSEFADFVGYDDRLKYFDLQLKIIRIYPDMGWQKQFKEMIGEAAAFMEEKITAILASPENNLQYKAIKVDKSKLTSLTNTLNQLQQ